MLAGSVVWLCGGLVPAIAQSQLARIVLSSVIISAYTFLAASELWRERRQNLRRRWPAVLVPILHGAVFLFPIPLAGLLPEEGGVVSLSSGWMAVLVLETMLYVVGSAFIVLVLVKERTVRIMKDAAATDELTRLLNRRGFLAAAEQLIERLARKGAPVSVLMFDLDHFKSINDRFGHAVGDDVLRVFASVARASMRESDVLGRLGGEEFAAIVPAPMEVATRIAERLRAGFEAAGVSVGPHAIGATVSIGAASSYAAVSDSEALIARADAALYRAKHDGRNRLHAAEDEPASEHARLIAAARRAKASKRGLFLHRKSAAQSVEIIVPAASGEEATSR
jgi:diguanylate cyclase (GGDEF)-like protein